VGDASLPSAAQPTARAKPKKTKKKASTRQTVFGCLTIVVIVLVIVAVVVAVTSGHKTPVAQQARDYIAKYKPDIVMVQGNVQTVQADMTAKGSLDQTAQDAQGVHDTLDKIRDNFVTTDTSGALGNDETEVFGAVNDLKNAMGALVTYTGTPNPATLAQFKSQYQTAVGEWDNGIDGIWQLAGTPTAAMKAAGLATPPTL
jgi:hypothetical protein